MNSRARKLADALLTLLFWAAVWLLLARIVGQELLLPAPGAVLKRLAALAGTADF